MGLPDTVYLQINQALFSVAHAYESRMAKEKGRNALGLRMSDCSVLMVLGRFAPINSRRLSKLMDVNPGAVSLYVRRLVRMGLVRMAQDTEDRRNWRLALTAKGRVASRGVTAGAVEYTKGFLAALDEAERRALHALLLKTSHSIGFDWQ